MPPETEVVETPEAPAPEVVTDAPAPAAEAAAEPTALERLEQGLSDLEGLYDGEGGPKTEGEPKAEAQPPADKPADAPKGEAPKPDAKPVERAFTVRGADGKDAQIQWPEGAKVVFKYEGKDRSIESLDQLVRLAQKGDLLDLKASEFGIQKREWIERESGLTHEIEEGKAAVKEAERVLRAVVTDDDARARVRAAMEQYDDPNAKEARDAKEEAARLKAERERAETRQRTQVTERFWAATQERVAANVGEGKRFPMLDAEDAQEIQTAFWERYQQHTIELMQQKIAAGLGEGAAVEQAAAEGLRWLTEENLYGIMGEMNERIARRLGRTRQDPAQREPTDPEAADAARAERHNARVERKLEQKRQSPPIKGPPSPSRTTTAGRVPAGVSHQSAIDKEWEELEARVGR